MTEGRPGDVFIHPTAEVHADAEIGAGSRLWQHCVVLAGARLGARCKLAHNVFVEGGATLGDGVTVKDNVCLYDGVTVADDVFIGPNAVFTNVTRPRAFRPHGRPFVATWIGQGATIGANATIVCGVRVGRFAMVGAGTVVTRDVPDHALVLGNPARQAGWVGRHGAALNDALTCPETGERYVPGADGLTLAEEA